MAHPWTHAESSARHFGGQPAEYLALHDWFDATKSLLADFRHRALRHHAEGIFLAESIFGSTILAGGRQVPVRLIAEQHVKEDFGGLIPSAVDWLRAIQPEDWMIAGPKRRTVEIKL